jgi:hypothetical protein
MQTLFGLYSLENAEGAVVELEQRLGREQVNLIAQEAIKARVSNGRAQSAAEPGVGAPVPAPTLAQLLGRKRPVFLAETGPVYAVNDVAAHLIEMAQSPAPTKMLGSLKVALEEYGVATNFAEAYATGVAHGYVLVLAEVPGGEIVETGERLAELGGREVFSFQRLE